MKELNEALAHVSTMLMEQQYRHRRLVHGEVRGGLFLGDEKGTIFFNMNWWCSRLYDAECGTVMCIGGMCEHHLKRSLTQAERDYASDLFYPSSCDMQAINAERAARAINNFLREGRPLW